MIDVGSLLARDAVLGAVPTFGESVEACDEVAPALIYDYRGFDEVFVVYLVPLIVSFAVDIIAWATISVEMGAHDFNKPIELNLQLRIDFDTYKRQILYRI